MIWACATKSMKTSWLRNYWHFNCALTKYHDRLIGMHDSPDFRNSHPQPSCLDWEYHCLRNLSNQRSSRKSKPQLCFKLKERNKSVKMTNEIWFADKILTMVQDVLLAYSVIISLLLTHYFFIRVKVFS